MSTAPTVTIVGCSPELCDGFEILNFLLPMTEDHADQVIAAGATWSDKTIKIPPTFALLHRALIKDDQGRLILDF